MQRPVMVSLWFSKRFGHVYFLFFVICFFWYSPCVVHFCSREIMYCLNHHHVLPCLHCHPHSYIRMVQHLIERCLLLHMNRQQCIKALAKYASIRLCITVTGRYIQRKPRFERKKQHWNSGSE
ncbi:hypothetical protein CRYUN_Cryun21dG0066100 [Craigia yunnanensis]